MAPSFILLFALFFVSSHCAPQAPHGAPCKSGDNSCMLAVAKSLYKTVLAGDKSLGAEPLEPLHLDEVDGSLTTLKFKMLNTSVTGYNQCDMNDLKVDAAQSSYVLKIRCPHLETSGNYDMDGRLIVLPVQGKGKFSLIMDVYDVTVTGTYKIVKDGAKEYVSIKTYQAEAVPIKGVKFEFQNLFNGKQDLANTVHKFANENWREVTLQFQGPIVAATFKKLIKNTNKFLKAMAMDKVFL